MNDLELQILSYHNSINNYASIIKHVKQSTERLIIYEANGYSYTLQLSHFNKFLLKKRDVKFNKIV